MLRSQRFLVRALECRLKALIVREEHAETEHALTFHEDLLLWAVMVGDLNLLTYLILTYLLTYSLTYLLRWATSTLQRRSGRRARVRATAIRSAWR